MHPDQVPVTAQTARALIAEQFPEWAPLPVREVRGAGTVNAIFRLGDRLTARFPLQAQDPEKARRELRQEADVAAQLSGRTRFPTPVVVALGEPGPGYPMPWSVQTWLPGVVAIDEDPGDSVAFARDLAEFVRGVRAIPTQGRVFSGRGRGGDLPAHDDYLADCFERSGDLLDVPRLRALWRDLRTLPRTAPDVMSHKDLIPGNLLVADSGPAERRLAGVLDVGGLGPADPALDLVAAWHVLTAAPRQVLREELECDDVEWERGRAWAFQQAMGLVWYYRLSNPTMSELGRRTLERLLAT
jgi:aminoglycoside phosphotransferase (APT) family kinase protein